ncbi:hypothetical protein GHT09_000284 [Marmota monax]|uniref:Uncharacterized protein n=1 Tax=Marmota monax TaxID=9995 RepID=A0A834V8B6_MARMO|nr:hypothetical protein GHT09_000284 [Marmota monax]
MGPLRSLLFWQLGKTWSNKDLSQVLLPDTQRSEKLCIHLHQNSWNDGGLYIQAMELMTELPANLLN